MTTVLKLAGITLAIVGAVINLRFFFSSDTDVYPMWMLLPGLAALILLVVIIVRRRSEQRNGSR